MNQGGFIYINYFCHYETYKFLSAGTSAGAVQAAHIISRGLAHLQRSWRDFYLPPQLQTTPAAFAVVCRKGTGKDRHLLPTTNTCRGGETQSHACGGSIGGLLCSSRAGG